MSDQPAFSTTTQSLSGSLVVENAAARPGRPWWVPVAVGGVALLLLAVARVVTGVNDLTSSGAFGAAVRVSIPIGLAGLGGLYAERAGVVNIGLEGMMILGTWCGAWAGFELGPWWGVLAGALGGALGALLHAVATVTFNVNHIVSGIAINILGGGVARFLSSIAFADKPGGGITQSPIVQGDLGHVSVPFLAGGEVFGWTSPDPLRWVERHHWFVLSDVAGAARGLTANLTWLTLLCFALFPLSAWVLWRTRFGLRLRSVGESPMAAESLGVDVYRMKYYGVLISGALAGLAGAFIVLVSSGAYKEGQTGGRGFIGLAAMIFGNWRPAGVAVGSALFGFADALQTRSNANTHALLVFVGLAGFAGALLFAGRRRGTRALLCAAVGAAAVVWYNAADAVPGQFVTMTPYVVTLVVLALVSQRLRMPAADGLPYRKGQVQ